MNHLKKTINMHTAEGRIALALVRNLNDTIKPTAHDALSQAGTDLKGEQLEVVQKLLMKKCDEISTLLKNLESYIFGKIATEQLGVHV